MNDKKLKIAMLDHKRVPSRECGIEIVVEELASRMIADGHEVKCAMAVNADYIVTRNVKDFANADTKVITLADFVEKHINKTT